MEDHLHHLIIIIIIIVLTTIDLIAVDTTIIIIEVAIAAEATILLRFIIIIIIEEEIAVEDRVGMVDRKRYRACRNSLPWKTNGLGSKIGAAHVNNVKGRPVSLIFCPIHPLRLLQEQPPWPIHPSWPPPMRQPPR